MISSGITSKSLITPPSGPRPTCKVWTASYGGGHSVIIRARADQQDNYTVLDVNEGSEKREAEAYISAYAKGGKTVGEFANPSQALDKAFELCPDGSVQVPAKGHPMAMLSARQARGRSALRLIAAAAVLALSTSMAEAAPPIRSSNANPVPKCVTPARLMAFLTERNPHLDPRYRDIASLYKHFGEAWRVRWDYAFFQMAIETNFLKFRRGDGRRGDVGENQNNFAGIGATGGGVHGERFADVATGVHAQIQHLVAYSGERLAEPIATRTRQRQGDIVEASRAAWSSGHLRRSGSPLGRRPRLRQIDRLHRGSLSGRVLRRTCGAICGRSRCARAATGAPGSQLPVSAALRAWWAEAARCCGSQSRRRRRRAASVARSAEETAGRRC